MDKKESISWLIKQTHLKFQSILELKNKQNGLDLTCSQCEVIGFMDHHNKMKPTEEINPILLERTFQVSRATICGILKRLEDKNVVEVIPSQKDNRYKQIVLTENASEFKSLMNQNLIEADGILLKGISEEEQAQFKYLLTKVLNNLKEERREYYD